MTIKSIRIATRESPLAMWQAEHVKSLLLAHYPDLAVSFLPMKTAGDKDTTQALAHIGGKTLFVKELQKSLLDNKADIAVHCIKDMSVFDHPGLTLSTILERGNPADVFVSTKATQLSELPVGSTVGTSSPRRQSLILSQYPHLIVKTLRGNVPTRLAKLAAGDCDAAILAAIGLQRLNLESHIQSYFDTTTFTPAIGQGALGIECHSDRAELIKLLEPLNYTQTAACITAERAVNRVLHGDCHTPIGAHATCNKGTINLNAVVGSLDGKTIIRASDTGSINDPETLGESIAQQLISQGAKALLGK